MHKLAFYSDPGHGWLKVHRAELERLPLETPISRYSYLSSDGQHVYLEEDCDAGIFLRALRAAGEGYAIQHYSRNSSSPIRRMRSYVGPEVTA